MGCCGGNTGICGLGVARGGLPCKKARANEGQTGRGGPAELNEAEGASLLVL